MGTFYPLAIQKPIVRNHGGRRSVTRGAVVHVDAGGAASLQGWFNNPASSASCHFYVKYDGTVEQYLDADLIAWTQRAGNTTCVGIETQGLGSGSWTPAQLAALVHLLRWLSERYGIPLANMVDSRRSSRGVGIHRFGIDPYRVAGGEVWGPYAKACPGGDRVAQFPGLIASLVVGSPVVVPVVTPVQQAVESQEQIIARMNAGYSVAWIKAIQIKLNRLGFNAGDEDGVRGAKTIAAVKAFQKKAGIKDDGLPGADTNDHLDKALAPAQRPANTIPVQQALRATTDGIFGPDSQKRANALRAASGWGKGKFPYGVAFTQGVVGARQDGDWGKLSRKAHDDTTKNLQRALGVEPDGIWGDISEAAYLAFLKAATK